MLLNTKQAIAALLCTAWAWTAAAQETIYPIEEVSVINYGDGRLLYRQTNEQKTPLNGSHRLIDGYRSACIVAEFKDGMYHGTYQYFRNNKLREEGTYKNGRKDGVYKEYYSDGTNLQREVPFTDGKLNGVIKTYYTSGKLESEKGYAMGVEHGVERRYDYQTGQMTSNRNYFEGRQDGPQVSHISSNIGQYVETACFDKGKRVGEYLEVFDDGTLKTKGQYNDNGNKEGEWWERDSFSDKSKFAGKVTVYNDGQVVSVKEINDFDRFSNKKK